MKKFDKENCKLENVAHLNVNGQIIHSNNVIVIVKKIPKDDWIGCEKPYLGYK